MSLLYTYSLIRSFYNAEEDGDYIDSFIPLVVTSFESETINYNISSMQRSVKDKFDFDIPQYSLEIIISRAKNKGYLTYEHKQIYLTETGKKLRNTFLSDRDVERRINELISNALDYVKKTGNVVNEENIKDYLFAFVRDNLRSFDVFLTEQSKAPDISPAKFSKSLDQAMVEYFLHIERTNEAQFKTLQDIIAGSIISVSVYSKSISEIGKKFENLSIYLDTNFVFSLLGLHHKEQCDPVLELYRLISESNPFHLKVFDFTINEIKSVLNGYKSAEKVYVSFIQTDSIYSSLKQKRWTRAEVVAFIAKLEETLLEKGISIVNTGIELDRYAADEKQKEELLKVKEYKSIRGANHDLAAIEKIRGLRGCRTTRIENSKAIFLTSDLKLAKFNYNLDHKSSMTVGEIITDRLFTNLLWLKKPKNLQSISLSSIISAFKSGKLIHHDVWDRFIDRLSELRSGGRIEDADVSSLLYDKHFQEIMYKYRNDPSVIDDSFVLSNIEAAKAREERQKSLNSEREIRKDKLHEMEISHKLAEIDELQETVQFKAAEFSEAEQKKMRLLEILLGEIGSKKKIHETKSKNFAYYTILLIRLFISVLAVLVLYAIYNLFTSNWSTIEPIVAWLYLAIPLIVWFLSGTIPSSKQLFARVYDKIYSYQYKKRLESDTNLNQLEQNVSSFVTG